LLHIPKGLDIFNGLKAKAMAGIPGNRSGSMNDKVIQPITLEPRLAGRFQQGPRGNPKL
jgi:hypothetical protein